MHTCKTKWPNTESVLPIPIDRIIWNISRFISCCHMHNTWAEWWKSLIKVNIRWIEIECPIKAPFCYKLYTLRLKPFFALSITLRFAVWRLVSLVKYWCLHWVCWNTGVRTESGGIHYLRQPSNRLSTTPNTIVFFADQLYKREKRISHALLPRVTGGLLNPYRCSYDYP